MEHQKRTDSSSKSSRKPIKAQTKDWMREVSSKSDKFDDQLRQFVSERPVAVMLSAVALGYVANRVLMSSMAKAPNAREAR